MDGPNHRAIGKTGSRLASRGVWPAVVAMMVVASAALADPPPATPPQNPPGPSLFISPSGQPFRAAAGEPYPVALWFAQADRNGDGRIDRAEFRADAAAFFKILDKNHDGVIDGFEISDYEHDMVPEIMGAYRAPVGPISLTPIGGTGRDGHHRGGKDRSSKGGDNPSTATVMGGAAPYELYGDPEPVAAADRTFTRRITPEDFLAAADRRFDLLDPKGLGYLTLADLPKTPVQRAAELQARRR